MTDINVNDLRELLSYFSKSTYRVKDADSTSQAVMQRCILLADLDYTHTVITNSGGELSSQYPSHLIILDYEKHRSTSANCDTPPPSQRTATETIYESTYDSNKLKDLMRNARFARCRSRFPLPVMLYKGRHVCRSATLSGGPEIYGRSSLEYFFAANDGTIHPNSRVGATDGAEANGKAGESMLSDWQLFDKVRNHDIKLLKTLNVGTIIDFMVEKKKVKFGMNVTSSEKVDKERRYSEFGLVSLPYPGCEFFKEFRENDYLAMGLVFDWSQTHVDAEIDVPRDPISTQLRINWDQYQIWDLVNLTQNYLKLILRYLTDSSSGILIHCISGWDRTPLFISLLRISLWADGAIHQSLNAYQMLYFTIAYDWMLFGHDLQDRLAKGEEIFYFCFYFLKHIFEEEFSVNTRVHSRMRQHNQLRNDSDSHLDNIFEPGEIPVPPSSVSSNLSLNSCCSNISQNSRDSVDNNPSNIIHYNSIDGSEDILSNGNIMLRYPAYSSSSNKDSASNIGSRSPLPQNRTSPVAVPVPGRIRQRNESSSSAGSWQMISGTGSLRGSTTSSTSGNIPIVDGSQPGSSFGVINTGLSSQESSTTVIEEADLVIFSRRQKRLECLRQTFYTVYNQTVGLRMKDNSDAIGIGQLLGTFAEKVGILSVQRTSL